MLIQRQTLLRPVVKDIVIYHNYDVGYPFKR